MIRETFPVGLLQCNCTVLGDEHTREAIVVDPGDEISRILATLARHSFRLKQIIITHAHIDHIAGAQQLKALTGAPVLYSQKDLPLVAMMDMQAGWLGVPTPEVLPPDDDLVDGAHLHLGGTGGVVLHTPGHTPGSLCVYFPAESLLLAGDTLFRSSVGRTDLPGGDGPLLLRSIHERLLTLPGKTLVIPGHAESTSIEDERRSNPFLKRALTADRVEISSTG